MGRPEDGNECWTKKTNSHLEKRLRTERERTSITQQEISVGALLWMSYKQYYYYYCCCCIRSNNNNNNGTIGYNAVPIAAAQRHETNEDRDTTQHTHRHTTQAHITSKKEAHKRRKGTRHSALGGLLLALVTVYFILDSRCAIIIALPSMKREWGRRQGDRRRGDTYNVHTSYEHNSWIVSVKSLWTRIVPAPLHLGPGTPIISMEYTIFWAVGIYFFHIHMAHATLFGFHFHTGVERALLAQWWFDVLAV